MIDHVSIPVGDLKGSKDFYSKILAPLGLTILVERERSIGFGKKYPEFWLNERPNLDTQPNNSGCHICLRAATIHAVTEFHDTAVIEGGKSDGAPGNRHAAMTPYFGAFILDADGNKIEAACFPKK
ncbi:MAG: VOC family protein [Sneathiella sp.]|nr:VOC family protein [Sneathiella sp.]